MKNFAEYAKIRHTITWENVLGQNIYVVAMSDRYLKSKIKYIQTKIGSPNFIASYKLELKHELLKLELEIKYRKYIQNNPTTKVLYG